MGHVPFPRLQILMASGSWLKWVDDSEWCAPVGAPYDTLEFLGGEGCKVIEIDSQEESDQLAAAASRTIARIKERDARKALQ